LGTCPASLADFQSSGAKRNTVSTAHNGLLFGEPVSQKGNVGPGEGHPGARSVCPWDVQGQLRDDDLPAPVQHPPQPHVPHVSDGLLFFFALIRKKPFVLSTHGSLLDYKKHHPSSSNHFPYKLYDALTFKTTAQRADAVVVSSQMEYEEALEFGIHKNKLHIIPDGIEAPGPAVDRSSHQGAPVNLLFAGPMDRFRRVELLLRAARKLTLPFRITLVATNNIVKTDGSTEYLTELKKLAKSLGIEDRVDFLGNPSPEDMKNCYSDADLFINPSTYETSGKILLDAAASGLPVISTPVGLANEIVASGENGFIVPADPDMICDRILQLSNPDKRQNFGRLIREKVLSAFGWNTVMDRYMELYGSLK
jgi:glycosyltransferase involved in cell wall biosynthesis